VPGGKPPITFRIGCPVGHVAVGEHLAFGVDDRHLTALAVHADPDVNRHDRASFPSST
jgi:hypothetical protein